VQNTILGWILFGPIASDYWVNFRACILRSCSWNSRSRSSSLLGDWGSASESFSELWRAPVRRALQNHAFPYTEWTLYRSIIVLKRITYLDRRITLYCSFELSPLGTTLNSRSNYHFWVPRISRRETLGHMIKSLPTEIVKPKQIYYIPHHAVLYDSSATTRLRVIFNASCRTSNIVEWS